MEQYSTGVQVDVENIGGIEHTSVTLSPDVTVLSGRNATNRTSFLQAIMAACGSESVSLKADATEGEVVLSFDGTTYRRTITRTGDTIEFDGDPYLEDPTMVDLFAFLLESNEVRRAVARGDDLREILMRPVDTAEIQRDIERLQREKRETQKELEELDELRRSLPSLEEQRQELESEIEKTRTELNEVETAIKEHDTTVRESKQHQSTLENKLEELRKRRSNLEDTRFRLESQRESVADLREELDNLESKLEATPKHPEEELSEIEEQIDQLRDRKGVLDAEINELQSIIEFNKNMLESDGRTEVMESLVDSGNDDITDRLVAEETLVCWTCGNESQRDRFEETLDRLSDLQETKLSEVKEIEAEMEQLKSDRSEIREQRRTRDKISRRIRDINEEIDRREATIDDLEDQQAALSDEIEDLESEIDELESEVEEELIQRHRKANDLQFELGSLERDLEEVQEEIAETERRLEEYDDLEARLDEIREELTDRRTRIDQLEDEAVTRFNDHMEQVLDHLGYQNLDRVWLEQFDPQGGENRFELHIVRSEDGSTYEDTIDHLSESEREVVGLVFALAGYLVHEVHEECPFMLLDSLEALDAPRIAALIDYMREYVDYLVVALLPEDADAVNNRYTTISTI